MTVKPCCDKCRADAGWIITDPTDPSSAVRCPCRDMPTPEQVAAEAIDAAGQANPNALRHAYQIIEWEAEISSHVTANSVRKAMETAQIPGPIRAAAFRAAVAEGLLIPDGEVVSTDVGTHGKKVASYRVNGYARQLGVS